MPVADRPVHDKVKIDSSFRYGCHNRAPYKDICTGAFAYGSQVWKFNMSYECHMPPGDPACEGCSWLKES